MIIKQKLEQNKIFGNLKNKNLVFIRQAYDRKIYIEHDNNLALLLKNYIFFLKYQPATTNSYSLNNKVFFSYE